MSELPDESLRVDYGKQCPGSENPMPPGRRAMYRRRIVAAHEALAEGARRAGELFIGEPSDANRGVSDER